MGLSSASFRRFRSAVDATLRELFPCTLVIQTYEIAASGPGARSTSEYIEGGESENFRFPFRIARGASPIGWVPLIGGSIDWKLSDSQTIPLEITHSAIRASDDVWEITCKKRRS